VLVPLLITMHGGVVLPEESYLEQKLVRSITSTVPRFEGMFEQASLTITEIKPHRNGWKVFEAPGRSVPGTSTR
jgi:hypothetical protein